MTKSLTLHEGSMYSKSLTNCEKSWINVENKLHKENIEIVKEKAQVICQNFLWTTWVKSQSKIKNKV
jgi:thiamine kinase-like enzyme